MAEKGNKIAIASVIVGSIVTTAEMYFVTKKIENMHIKAQQEVRNSDQQKLAKKDVTIAELNKINNGLTSLYKNEHEKVIALQNENLNLSLENRCLKSRLSLPNTAAFAKDY